MYLKNYFQPSNKARMAAVLGLLFSVFVTAHAQDESSQYDRGTPPQHAAGVSAIGSYMSTDLGTINLSNGSLNFAIPLGTVGGRGFSLPLTLNYSSKVWSAYTGTEVVSDPTYRTYEARIARYDSDEAALEIYHRVAPGWSLGVVPVLKVRGVGISPSNNPSCGAPDYLKALTKLTVILPDKGEIELRDDYTDGSPLGALYLSGTNCRWMDGNRGQRWHATDGSGIVFVSDTANAVVNGNLNGWLITSGGTRYRFEDTAPNGGFGSVFLNEFARATSITDRNGNRIQIAYAANLVTYTDQLGRQTTIESNVVDPQTGETLAVRVTLPGYGGQTRQYKVKTGLMNQNYRAGINPTLPVYNGWTPGIGGGELCGTEPFPRTDLFASWCGGAERIDNRLVLTEVVLPDNRSLKFRYNEFGEVAEVEMPTGGKVQYDYAFDDGLPSGNSPGFEVVGPPGNVREVDRAVKARRTYPDGATLESSLSYEYSATPGVNGSASNGVTEVTARAADNSLMLWQKHYFLNASRFLTSQGGTGYPSWSTGVERRTETLNAAGAIISASEQDWSQRAPVAWSFGYSSEQIQNDNRVNQARRYLDDGSFAKTDTFYDNVNCPRANNVTEVWEYDFDQLLKRRTTTTYVTGTYQNDDSVHLLGLPLTQTVFDANGNQIAQTINEYDNYAGDGNHAPLLDYGAVVGHDPAYNGARTTRGNLTATGRWLNTINAHIYSYLRYDILGNVVSTKDPRGNVAAVSFADDFGNGSNPGGGAQGTFGATYALPTLITSPPPNPGEQPHTARSQYDFSTGLLTGFKDRNNVITQTIYDDPFNRPTLVKSALGVVGVEAHAVMYYAPVTTPSGITLVSNDVLTAKDQNTVGDAALRSWTRTDGFGRTVESWSRDPQGDVKVNTIYDALGRAKQVSNPYRPSLGEGAIYTTTGYDLAGRVISVTTPDGAVVATSYTGNTVTVTDQAGKQRKSVTDALGRLIQVYEAPNDPNYNYLTTHTYDALDNLITVTQGGQTRTFVYDSLKRLSSATNPESGTVSYQYDNNGNLTQKTDARGVVSTYVYDTLNRNTSVSYSDGTPSVGRAYDGAVNGKGRFWYNWTSAADTSKNTHTAIDTYDALGRGKNWRQHFWVNGNWSQPPYSMAASYDLAGHVTSMTYPSGRTVTNSYDTAGRLSSFAGNLGGTQRTYSTNISYSPFGGMKWEQYGTDTPLYHKTFYNIRGQMFDTRVSSVNDTWDWNRGRLILYYSSNHQWGGSGTDNNGNVRFSEHWIPPPNATLDQAQYLIEQTYNYDQLNRLSSVSESTLDIAGGGSWTPRFAQVYQYDRYGNRTVDQTSTWGPLPKPNFGGDAATNRLTAPAGYTMSYDAAGNLTTDTYTGQGTRTYDAENKMKQAWSNNQWQTYAYDGDGRRIKRIVNGIETWQVYGLGGELIAEYAANGNPSTPQKEYGYRNGELLIAAEAGSSQGGGSPFGGTPAAVPGTIEAENYDNGGAGVAYNDTTPGTHGQDYDQPPSYPPPAFR